MDQDELLLDAADAVREFGFDVDVEPATTDAADARMVLQKDGDPRTFLVEVKVPLTVSAVGHRLADENVLYVTDHVSARTAETLRRMGVSYVDAAGNAFLQTDGWYIDVRGRQRRQPPLGRTPLETTVNLYSARRAQVVFALLTWPDLLTASVRVLAKTAGVSIGIAQSTTTALRDRGLWPDHPDARATLIDGWAAAYPDVLARSLTIRSVRAEQFERFFGPVLASGEAAPSARIRPLSGVVYVEELSTELLIENRWRTDGPRNLVVRQRFWSRPEPATGEAPPLLVYGDLLASDDPRVRAVAAEYRSRL